MTDITTRPTAATLYHVTYADDLSSIMKSGLKPMIGPRAAEFGELTPAVYLFKDIESVENALSNWLGDAMGDDVLSLIAVVPAPDATYAQVECCAVYEVMVTSHIDASRLRVLAEDIDLVADLLVLACGPHGNAALSPTPR